MTIHSFLKVEKGDPDWQFSPERYFDKEFKVIDANTVELLPKTSDMMVLRQTPNEKELLAKHIRIGVKEEGKLDLIVINEADNKLQQVFIYDIHLSEGAGINFGIFVKDGKFNKHIIQVHMAEGSDFNSFGLISNTVAGDTEIITKIIHHNVDSSSNQIILAMAGKDSQTVFQGMSVLDKDSDGSSAHIESGNLIIGDGGRCHGKPDVYVNCDQVDASYGTITNHLMPENVYYLQSKGLSYAESVQSIISSFQSQVVDIVPYDNLREEIKEIFQVG